MMDRLVFISDGIYVSTDEQNWIEKVLDKDPTNVEALQELAKRLEKKGLYLKALDIYSQLAQRGNLVAKNRRDWLSHQLRKDAAFARQVREISLLDNCLRFMVPVLIIVLIVTVLNLGFTVFLDDEYAIWSYLPEPYESWFANIRDFSTAGYAVDIYSGNHLSASLMDSEMEIFIEGSDDISLVLEKGIEAYVDSGQNVAMIFVKEYRTKKVKYILYFEEKHIQVNVL